MTYRYAIIGSGRQGTAAAYDLGRLGEADLLLMADSSPHIAASASARVNDLLGCELARPATVDAGNLAAITSLLREHAIDTMLVGTPYFFNTGLTDCAISTGVGMTDLGGNSAVVFEQLARSADAERSRVSVVPDCGLGPGMITTLAVYAIEALDQPQDVYIWDCGLPQNPTPPWNYASTFSIEGLTNEYYGDCLFIRDGSLTRVPALEEMERIEFPDPVGVLEAFTTAGGITTAANTFAGRLRTLQNKTMRYPGHFAMLKVIQQLGLLSRDPVQISGIEIRPREVLHALWEPQIRAEPGLPDLALIRVLARGIKDGIEAEVQVDLRLDFDEKTGFSAMEQGTGWHASILTAAIAAGSIPHGVIPVERAMSGEDFVVQARRRGFDIRREIRST